MAFDVIFGETSDRDWSCGAADELSSMDLVDALESIDKVNRQNSKKILTGMKLGAVNDLERQNFSNFLRAWRSYMSQVKGGRTPRKQVLSDLEKWKKETNAWTLKIGKIVSIAKATLKQPISTRPPESLPGVVAAAASAPAVSVPAGVADDDGKGKLMLLGLGAGALAIGMILGGR